MALIKGHKYLYLSAEWVFITQTDTSIILRSTSKSITRSVPLANLQYIKKAK